ncbi:MAG: T9SS type A sorting domain-containing protein, partial [Ignavibacteria bacterium]|nr:T9SS type A sorting domain-containing protein [Ignavibacteria bacterium]
FEGFDSPTTVVVGKWDGANTNLVYVIDRMAKRVRLFEDRGAELSLLKEMRGRFDQYFSSAKVDHFGQVYLVDNVNSVVSKYTPSLELLDSEGGSAVFASLAHIDIPFGRIDIEGQGTRWAGFDQLFALERWGENSGAQRRTLGLALKNLSFRSDDDVSAIHNEFTMTDVGDIRVDVYDGGNTRIRRVHSGWMVSGGKTIQWDRRDDNGRFVPPGEYRYEIEARSAYQELPLKSQTRFTLPMYYWENGGSDNRTEDEHLVQGSVVRWGSSPSETANEDASSVQYRFRGLNPESEYMIAAEYVAHDGARRLQDLTVNGARLHDPVSVTKATYRTDYIKVPKDAYASGEILVSINKRAEGTAIVSQLWIKETGTGFIAQNVNESVPSRYALAQNYPNPFNPSTIIRYSLPADGNVSLKVYDVAGREIATLVNDFRSAGTYEARFDAGSVGGKALASGVYYYQVTAGSFRETKKMLLLK